MEQGIVAAGRTPNPLVVGWSQRPNAASNSSVGYGIASTIRVAGGSKLSN
jgi:hypothetical protein